MNEVTLVFQGMILMWTASNPPLVLVPDLTKMEVSHTSTISAPKSAFKSGACPPHFQEANETCSLVLAAALDSAASTADEGSKGNAGRNGGVQIEVASAAAKTAAVSAPALCAMPKLQQFDDEPLELMPQFTPPSGSRNAAWMSAVGGRSSAFMIACPNGDDCPRYLRWSVPVAKRSNAILVLRNLAGEPHDVLAELNDGATVTVANIPSADVLQARAEERSNEAGRGTDPNPVLETRDWCMYFEMVKTKKNESNGLMRLCKPPTIPECGGLLPVGVVTSHKHADPWLETIACSSSQYP